MFNVTPANNATVWRIYTESFPNLPRLIAMAGIDGATLIPATGVFRGSQESATVIEIITPYDDVDAFLRVTDLARTIRETNQQQSVLVTRTLTTMVELVEPIATSLQAVA